jgi:hypothetical protein
VGLPFYGSRDVVAAALPLVGANARSGRTPHAIPPSTDGTLLDSIHCPRFLSHFSSRRIRRLLPRAQVWPSQSDLRPLDARSDGDADGRRSAGSRPHGAVVWAGETPWEELVGVGRSSDDRVFRVRDFDRSGLHISIL